jgi:hypothetical protein
MNDPTSPTSNDLDSEARAALDALTRARKRAEKLAAQTGTDLIQAVDGKPLRIAPPQETREK